MKRYLRGLAMLALILMVTAEMPVRRTRGHEARRRGSMVDRNLIRLGRSYPQQPSAADIREALQRPTRQGNTFLRFGRSQQMTLTDDDLLTILRAYEDGYEKPEKRRSSNFVRLGRDPKFIRLGKSLDGTEYAQNSDLVVNVPPRKGRARDHFIRLGRDYEDTYEGNDEREKRSTAKNCLDCQY